MQVRGFLALARAMRPEAVGTLRLPVHAPPEQEVVGLVQAWVAEQTAALAAGNDRDPSATPWADLELGSVIDIQYQFVAQHRRVLQLVARCATDLPQLTQWWFVQRRRATLQQLAEYLQRRIDSGELPSVPDVPAAARFIVETIAWFAMHRHRDPDSGMLDDDACRRTVRHLLLAAFLPRGQ
jgi:AefR-like transcriptional repressor, C-terminal domain